MALHACHWFAIAEKRNLAPLGNYLGFEVVVVHLRDGDRLCLRFEALNTTAIKVRM